jgi:hypothetical protein
MGTSLRIPVDFIIALLGKPVLPILLALSCPFDYNSGVTSRVPDKAKGVLRARDQGAPVFLVDTFK